MNIRDIRNLKQTADQRLQSAPQSRELVLIYAGITALAAVLVTVINYCLSLQIDQTGGLSNIGLRSVLSTIQTVLPMVQWAALLCLELGYLNAMLRISREQYASVNSLRMGFNRFWTLLRCSLLQGLIYFGIMILSSYLAIQIFLITPLSREITELASGMMGGLNPTMTMDTAMMLDEATYDAFLQAMIPLFPIFGLVCLPLMAIVFYQYRMVNYILIDNPAMQPIFILRESRRMMKHNRFALFRVDVSLWWYHLLTFAVAVLAYGDVLLPMVGVTLPMSETVSYFLFYGLYLVAQFGLLYLFLNRVSVIHALAYQSLLPEKPKDSGVVLGNIFQM